MNRSHDLVLRRLLKKWVSDSKPPENGRARLLWEAAQTTNKKIIFPTILVRFRFDEHPAQQIDNWSQTVFFSWVIEHTIQSGMVVRVC